jgi:glycosyltransferase involved in cell wall biosynthesis
MYLSYSPTPRYYALTDRPTGNIPADLKLRWSVQMVDKMSWQLTGTSIADSRFSVSTRVPLHDMPEKFELRGNLIQEDSEPLRITPAELFAAIAKRYDYAESLDKPLICNASKPKIGFTVLSGSQRGGGTIQMYRYANWLSELGFDVTIYSDDEMTPDWANLIGSYVAIKDQVERYSAIKDEILFVYSLLELPLVLQLRDKNVQRVIHFCQGLEEFHFGTSCTEILSPKQIFHFLNSLPVGRLVVSSALNNYYNAQFEQRCYLVTNGIDPTYLSTEKRTRLEPAYGKGGAPIKILQVAKPSQALKGSKLLLDAVALMGVRYFKTNNISVTFVSGPKPIDVHFSVLLPTNVSYEVKENLTPEELRCEYESHDIVVNCSFCEGFGLSTIEALAVGSSVVQSNNEGLKGVVEPGIHALVVPINNVVALATAIASIVENPSLRERMKMAGKELAATFTIQKQYSQFVKAFSAITQGELNSATINKAFQRMAVETRLIDPPLISVSEPEKFSILVPVYNHDGYLGAALDTLRSQSYPHWEAVVVNDGSTDRTPEVMRAYEAQDSRFKLFHKTNGGTASALNAALEKASHKWICWLSSDDFFKSDKLETHAQFIKAYPHIKFFHSDYSVFNQERQAESPSGATGPYAMHGRQLQTLKFFVGNFVHGNTVAIHRDIFDRAGWFNPNYPSAQDFDMWLRMSRLTPFYYMNRVTCTTRIHSATGTFQFPEAGILDSQRSLIDLVNQFSFTELFPYVDFNMAPEMVIFIHQLLKVIGDPSIFLYKGVHVTSSPIFEKMYEWFAFSPSSAVFRPLVQRLVTEYIKTSDNGSQVFHPQLTAFLNKNISEVYYKRIDAVQQFVHSLEYALQTNNKEIISIVHRYLAKLYKQKVIGAIDIERIVKATDLDSILNGQQSLPSSNRP